jgi:diguanylate cyclase (GGDEF)-like protein
MLERESETKFDVTHVELLADARQALTQSLFDCVLFDLSLPDADRLEALQQLRTVAPEVPIVILSGIEQQFLAVRAVQEGAQDYLVKGRVDGHLLGRAINYAIERIRAGAATARRAMCDPLTGLPNRALLLDRLDHALTLLRRHGTRFAVLFMDLDGFKPINDTYGHAVGDRLLSAVAKRLRGALRETDTAARFGGDEFVILCESTGDADDAFQAAERVLRSVERPFLLGGHALSVSASVGIALAAPAASDAGILIQQADTAMYRAKERGAPYQIFSDEMGLLGAPGDRGGRGDAVSSRATQDAPAFGVRR